MKMKRNKNLWPFSKLVPNLVTLMSLCSGLSAIRFSIDGKFETAVILIILAAFIDGMDGRLARLFNASSSFGAQLDSLVDFSSFGIAPALTLYFWQLRNIEVRGLGWAIVLLFVICCCVRLARFNSDLDEGNNPDWFDKFFVGVPSTAGGCLALIPLMLSFRFDIEFFSNPFYVAFHTALIGILMASRLPFFSVKKITISREYVPIFMIISGVIFTCIIVEPWVTLPVAGMIYIVTAPFSIKIHKNLSKAQ